MEEALIEMYLAGVPVHRVEDVTEALWGSKVSPATISELNKEAYVHIEDWRNRPLQGGTYPYVYVDGIYLRRNWGGEYENVAILVAIAVNGTDTVRFWPCLLSCPRQRPEPHGIGSLPVSMVSAFRGG